MKEDVPVDVSTTMTLTQLTLIWILLGCLVTWMLFFAVLALRPDKKKIGQTVTASRISHATPPASEMVHVLAKTPVATKQVSTGQLEHEGKEIHSVPVHF